MTERMTMANADMTMLKGGQLELLSHPRGKTDHDHACPTPKTGFILTVVNMNKSRGFEKALSYMEP